MQSPTSNFQLAIPFILPKACPAIVAIHASRALVSNPALISFHCSKCGSLRMNDNQRIRVVRRGNGAHPRCLQRTCHACGWQDELPMERGNAALFPRRRPNARPSMTPLHLPLKRDSPVAVEQVHSNSPAPPRANVRPKKRSNLQEMLARNRQKEEQERSRKGTSGGLAAFLGGL